MGLVLFRLLPVYPAEFWIYVWRQILFWHRSPVWTSIFSRNLQPACRHTGTDADQSQNFHTFCTTRMIFLRGAARLRRLSAVYECLSRYCEHLGVPLAPEKTEGLSTTITLLGCMLDTIQQTTALPAGKLQELLDEFKVFTGRKSAT